MTFPNFLIIGAQKSGTSSLYRYLQSHPQIFMSKIKEPKFFALDGDTFNFNSPIPLPDSISAISNQQEYKALFAEAGEAKAIGEASTWYLNSPTAAKKIKQFVPDMKLIAILRHPVDRAFSSFHHNVRLGMEPIQEFGEAVSAEKARVIKNWGYPWYYIRNGLYTTHLQKYFELFDAEQIQIFLLKQLRQEPQVLFRKCFEFLGVDPEYQPDISKRYNVSSKSTKSNTLHTFLNDPNTIKDLVRPLIPIRLRRFIKYNLQKQNQSRPEINSELRSQLLQQVYYQDIQKLSKILHLDLSDWLK